MSDEPLRIRLEPAWSWTCPCGARNFVEGMRPEPMTAEDEPAVREALDLQPWEPLPEDVEDQFTVAPERVSCGRCKRVSDVEAEVLEGDEDLPGPDEGGDGDEEPAEGTIAEPAPPQAADAPTDGAIPDVMPPDW